MFQRQGQKEPATHRFQRAKHRFFSNDQETSVLTRTPNSGRIHAIQIGQTRGRTTLEPVTVRSLRREDLEAIVQIDEKVLGEKRREYWERKLETMDNCASQASFVAEDEGSVVGFVLGDVSGWEFGVPDTTGWIDTIGVDPAYQNRGIARMLAQKLIDHFKPWA